MNAKTTKTETPKDAKQKNGKKKAAAQRELPSERLGVPPTTPDVDAKVEAAEATHDAANGAAKTKEATTNASAGTGRDTGERGANGGQPVAEGGKAMSLMDAAVNILSQGTGECRNEFVEAPRIHLHALEQHAVRQLPAWRGTQFLHCLEALGMEGVLGDVTSRHEEHAPRLVHDEGRRPLDGGQADARRGMVLADGIEERQLAGLLADAPPDRGADRIAPGLGGAVFGLGLFPGLGQKAGRRSKHRRQPKASGHPEPRP
jgi:hypothetical protein